MTRNNATKWYRAIRSKLEKSVLFPSVILLGRFRSPRTRVYGVGAAKTGTHSLATMFADQVRSAHEADSQQLIELLLEGSDTNRKDLRTFLQYRDTKRKLWIDSSQVNMYLLDDILTLYPDSRFILTLRPPMDWLRSIIDDSLRRETTKAWIRFRNYRFDRPGDFPQEEAELKRLGLSQLAGYLSYWSDAITRVVDKVPAEQLMIVRTQDLHARAQDIANFCGVGSGDISPEQAHSFANPKRFNVLGTIPHSHLLAVAERECGDVFRSYFPERNLDQDVRDIIRVTETDT